MAPSSEKRAAPNDARASTPSGSNGAVLDARTRTLYSKKRAAKYNRHDNERSVSVAALILGTAVAFPLILGHFGLISPSLLHSITSTLRTWWDALGTVNAMIVACVTALALFSALVWVVHQYRHRHDPIDITLPSITPPACTFFTHDFVLGQGCTEDGLQPGDVLPAERDDTDILAEFNVFIRGDGVFQNTKLEGAPGTGKSSLFESLIAQAVRKYPVPPSIPRDAEGQWFPVPAWDTDEHERVLRYVDRERRRYLEWETRAPKPVAVRITALRRWRDKRLGGERYVTAAGDSILTAAYGGLTTEDAVAARQVYLEQLHKRRPSVLVVNAKPESDDRSLVDHLVRCASADSPERSAQVYLVSPDLGTSVAMFDLARTNADLASTISTTISVIDGETDRFWSGQMTSLVACLVGVMKAAMPGRITWLTLLNLLRTKETFDGFVSDARARFEMQSEAERKNELIEGPRVNHVELSELQRFSELDDKKFTETTAHILNFGGKLTAGDLVRTIAPEVPTYGTMDEVVREGGLLGLDMPLTRYQDVSIAVNTMLINAYVAAIMEVARTSPADEMREAYLFIDESASYMTKILERSLSQNRSAKMGVFLAYQIRTQFDSTDTTASKTLGTTCANTISFRDPDGISAEMKSKSYGMRETLIEDYGITESLGRVQGATGRPGSDSGGLTQSGSIRQTVRDVPRFKPEIVQSLPQGHAIVMVSDGRNPYPARRIKTLRTVDIPWLGGVEKMQVAAKDYVPPIPICVLAGEGTDWAAADRLKVLAEASDPTRDDVLAMRSLWSKGEIWGVLIFTRTFAFVIEARHLKKQSALIERALSGILKPGYATPFQPTVVLVDVEDGRTLARAFRFDLQMPFPIVQAAEAVSPPSPEREAAARKAAADLSPDVGAYVASTWSGSPSSVRGIAWFTVSSGMRRVLDVYKEVDGSLRNYDSTLPQSLRADWSDAVASDGPATVAPSDPTTTHAAVLAPGVVAPTISGPQIPVPTFAPPTVALAPTGSVGSAPALPAQGVRRRGATVPTVDAVLAFLQGAGQGSEPQAAPAPGIQSPPVTTVAVPTSPPAPPSHDLSQPAAPDPASEPSTSGSVKTDVATVLAGEGAGVPVQHNGHDGVLEPDATTHGTAVCSTPDAATAPLGIPHDNPFDV
ncbi:MAG: hypothetical protein ACR2M1_08605 [Gemmatimonadaceae bacterium]